ncbi:MAG: hypothetical protein A2X49_04590 [Lentisphaerae bacterium GWF2_52_8]|nr:MAG: hypothetical protein A2X49_04590 [Lentisphaerae bacterium GWF2_52_8]
MTISKQAGETVPGRTAFLFVIFALVFQCATTAVRAEPALPASGRLLIAGPGQAISILYPLISALSADNPALQFSLATELEEAAWAKLNDKLSDMIIVSKRQERNDCVIRRLGSIAAVLAVSEKNPVSNISGEQFRNILGGSISSWKQLGAGYASPIKLALLANDKCRLAILHSLLPRDLTKLPATTILSSPGFLLPLLQEDAAVLAIMPTTILKSTEIKILSIDGVYPGTESIVRGEYKLTQDLYLVYPESAADGTKNFADWLCESDLATTALAAQGLMRTKDIPEDPLKKVDKK